VTLKHTPAPAEATKSGSKAAPKEMIGVYVYPEEKEKFQAQAEAEGRTMAGHARHILMKAMRG